MSSSIELRPLMMNALSCVHSSVAKNVSPVFLSTWNSSAPIDPHGPVVVTYASPKGKALRADQTYSVRPIQPCWSHVPEKWVLLSAVHDIKTDLFVPGSRQ